MCLSPKLIINRRYLKICDGDVASVISHFQNAVDLYVSVDCGLCRECQQKRGKHWRTRLLDEYHYQLERDPDVKVSFITLTYDNESLHRFRDNPAHSVRLFLERYRKRYGKSFKHFITTEFGEKRGRLHLHMIAFEILCNAKELRKLWSYGRIDMQNLRGAAGLTYVSGYITKEVNVKGKQDRDIPLFITPDKKTVVFVSPGFGRLYRHDEQNRHYVYKLGYPVFVNVRDNGLPYAIPRYYHRLYSPLDIIRKKRRFIHDSLTLPKPPYKILNRMFTDYATYVIELNKLGGFALLNQYQFANSDNKIQNIYLWQTIK